MAWREVTLGDTRWCVSPVAERVAHATAWRLVLAFRSPAAHRRSIWATYPLESSSRSALFAQADRLSNEKLTALLAERIR